MNSQMHTGTGHGAAKKRREYLRKRAQLMFGCAVGGGVGLFTLSLCAALFILSSGTVYPTECFRLAWVFGFVAIACRFLWSHCAGKARSLVYVPPAAEQIAALPAAEILVRGSHQPAATPSELLRAARQGAETTDAGELLRAESGPL